MTNLAFIIRDLTSVFIEICIHLFEFREKKFDDAILRHCRSGGRLLGICLGFQVLLESSDEDGGTKTLGILPGKTVRLKSPQTHNGWENIDIDLRKCKLKNCWQGSKLSRRKKFSGRVYTIMNTAF